MPRKKRVTPAGFVFHVYNRGSRKGPLFDGSADYDAFTELMEEARKKYPVRIIAHCLMRTHVHLMLWPSADHAIPGFMQWLESGHARIWHSRRGTKGTGAVFQSRYGLVMVENDFQYYATLLYVERNALEAGYVELADAWPWSSAWQGDDEHPPFGSDPPPLPRYPNWLECLNARRPRSKLALAPFEPGRCRKGQTRK
jgi:REP-associated tyrosine transposase